MIRSCLNFRIQATGKRLISVSGRGSGKMISPVGVFLTIHVLTMMFISSSVTPWTALKFRNNSLFSILCRRYIWMFLLTQIFCFRSCRTWVRLTKPPMRSLKNIYRISTPSKSMPPDFTRISITTSDVLEVSIHHYLFSVFVRNIPFLDQWSKPEFYSFPVSRCHAVCHASTPVQDWLNQIFPWHFNFVTNLPQICSAVI